MIYPGRKLHFTSQGAQACQSKNTVVIFAGLDFREFVIFELYAMSRIRELLISMQRSIIIIIFARFLNTRSPLREN